MCKSYSHWGLFEDPIEAQDASSVPFVRQNPNNPPPGGQASLYPPLGPWAWSEWVQQQGVGE